VLLLVRARDPEHLQRLVFRVIGAGEGLVQTQTMLVTSQEFAKPGPHFERIAELGAPED